MQKPRPLWTGAFSCDTCAALTLADNLLSVNIDHDIYLLFAMMMFVMFPAA